MRITKLLSEIPESLLQTVGIRIGAEEPHFLGQPLTGDVEIRKYGPRIAAETTVEDGEDRARNVGFRRLARYIFGANHHDQEIAMTAPVAQQSVGNEIAMTAPVAQSRDASGRWTIRFFMPSKWTLDTLPDPDDDDVSLVEVPGETVAVLRFSGNRGPKAVADHTDRLLKILSNNGIEPAGDAVAWFYDPPWTLPFRRRNEIAIPLRQS
jgi:hypothetical protein